MDRFALALAPLAAALALVAGCGDDDPQAGPTTAPAATAPARVTTPSAPAPSAGAPAFPIADAAAFRDRVLEIASGIATEDPGQGDFGLVALVRAEYPELQFRGYQVDADPTGISGFTFFPVDDKDVPSSENPWRLGFTVKDSAGACAGGVVQGFPVPNEVEPAEVPAGQPCLGAVIQFPAR